MDKTQKLLSQLTARLNWKEILPYEYEKYGIANLPEAKVLSAYKVELNTQQFNILSLYDYGKDNKFIKELESTYLELQQDFDEQNELGITPVYWECCGKNIMLSVISVKSSDVLYVVDIFFVYSGEVYCYHTYIPSSEKDLDFGALIQKYDVIGYVLKEINGLKK